jgi:hypothetical protein
VLIGDVDAGGLQLLELYTGDVMTVAGVKAIAFDDKAALKHYGFRDKSYTTCRNFQFGAQAFHEGLLPLDEPERLRA